MLIRRLIIRLITALQFLTRIPIRANVRFTSRRLGKSMVFYPMIGSLIGGILVGLNTVFGVVWSNLVVKALILVILIMITGGLHLDGYIDTIDGIFSGRSKQRMLDIMRDSRVGAHGVTGLISLLLLKFAFLTEITTQIELEALVLMPTLSRWAIVYAAAFYPYAREEEEGLGAAGAKFVETKELSIASLWTAILAGLLLGVYGLVAFVLVWIMTVIIIRVITKRIDGLTGDSYGAINELIEVFSLLVLTLLH
ncbi:adenosylcobinamide-GDP ribazoletransferase [Sporohalobacter salinus]|uniref:adenosylcobinamide-GDP ribazoletransferase n=1 Tax=Sporohalobacter salinus TaxID=1494606 RepID=UPI001961DE3E|nr:adenosylcobinamide-GDP ribazoletransferase [Sporohalobacter salinus]MBM7623596.1 adenosylcobinamide-GDP ribazoletransferase [Sporohalobacter salinus]